MTANARRGGAEDLQLIELEADPAPPIADTLLVYAKDVNGAAELFVINDTGEVSALTPRLMPLATAPATRVMDAAFQINTTRTTLVSYTIRVEFSGGAGGRVELLVGATPLAMTDRGRVGGGGDDGFIEAALITIVPPGHFVMLQRVDEVGTPIYTITTQTEVTF